VRKSQKLRRREQRQRAKQMALDSGWYKSYFGEWPHGLRLWFNNRFHFS
jgi:hypothetical protein